MPDKAHVTSVEAIEDFRTQIVLYVSKARPALEEVTSDVLRMRLWLENEQRTTLEALVRRRRKEFDQAQAALSSARMAVFKHDATGEQMAMLKARRALDEAEAKLKRVKYWDREFATTVEPLAKQLEKLHTFLANDLTKASAHLSRVVQMLDAYADVVPDAAPGSPSVPGASGTASLPADAGAPETPATPKEAS